MQSSGVSAHTHTHANMPNTQAAGFDPHQSLFHPADPHGRKRMEPDSLDTMTDIPGRAPKSAAVTSAFPLQPGFAVPPISIDAITAVMQPAAPNRTLFIQELPEDCTETSLENLFNKYAGFQEVRLIAGRRMAFADFDTEGQAGHAMNALQGLSLGENQALHISYAKR